MHRVQSRTYVGQPGETVTVTTTTGGGGQVSITVAGQPVVGGQFRLPNAPGGTARMQIALVGPKGASCAVVIAVVDGSQDTDFLLCTTFNPAPVNFYDFAVAAVAAVATLAAAKGVPVTPKAGLAAAKPAAVAAARPKPKTAKKRAARASRRGK